MPSTRRAFLTAAGAAALAGCSGSPTVTDTLSPVPSDPTDTPPDGDERPTMTRRDPTPLDVSGAWPQRGFRPGHGGVTAAPGVPSSGEPYWRLARVRSGPVALADGRLFHYARLGEEPDGPRTVTPSPERYSTGRSPQGEDSSQGEKYLVCRGAREGRIRWRRRLDFRSNVPVVASGLVVVAGDGTVAAFRASDGRPEWHHDLGARTAQASTVVDGTVLAATSYVRENDRKPDVRAYDAADGTHRWTRPSPKWRADVAAAGETVFSLSSQFQVGSVLTARSLANGSERWTVSFDDNGIPAPPVVAGDTVYVAPDNGGVVALDRATGDERWRYDAETRNIVGVAASDDAAYLVDDGRLLVLDPADGGERWSATTKGEAGYRGTPAVGRDVLYLERGGIPADVVALSPADGSERWRHQLPQTVVHGDMVTAGLAAQPAVADGAVFAFAEDGLYAFGPADG